MNLNNKEIPPMSKHSKIHIQGYRSIRYQQLEFGPLNVLIG